MSIEIRSGPGRVIASGEATTFGGQPLRFDLTLDECPLAVEMAFRSDPSVSDVAVESARVEALLRFDLVNFDGPDGRGSARPVLLGEIGDALVFLHFRVFRWGRTDDRTVHYTFYRVAKPDVGWTPSTG